MRWPIPRTGKQYGSPSRASPKAEAATHWSQAVRRNSTYAAVCPRVRRASSKRGGAATSANPASRRAASTLSARCGGPREVLGLSVGPAETEAFWTDLLRGLVRRGLRDVKLVVSDADQGLKTAIAKILGSTWQRCRVHFMRNVLAHVPRKQNQGVAATIRTAFCQQDQASAREFWRETADRLGSAMPKVSELMDEAKDDVLALMSFPKEHWPQLASTNMLERLNKETCISPNVELGTRMGASRGCSPVSSKRRADNFQGVADDYGNDGVVRQPVLRSLRKVHSRSRHEASRRSRTRGAGRAVHPGLSGKALTEHSTDDVTAYPTRQGRHAALRGWQVAQGVVATRNLFLMIRGP